MVLPIAHQVYIAFGVYGQPHELTLGYFIPLSCITPFTTFKCEEHIPSAPKSCPGIGPMHIKLRLYHLIGTLYMLVWVRMPESGVVLVATNSKKDDGEDDYDDNDDNKLSGLGGSGSDGSVSGSGSGSDSEDMEDSGDEACLYLIQGMHELVMVNHVLVQEVHHD
ncbi:hypothetical protein FRACYDRAFT_233533 [Fragilariopsis cylindrus CCMP1102]|uniref:Uncharacterized protein n=1 Tax=Fragilariopsis cylindrus CCMP1102 TaxID=635003 RepID=A0A1E7FYY3_9STRA|nr:hypothetical protein FRACYDRAFT_233533 [Fragilariopsis cylindrus CCMP1102]|eukprot:OEU23360.1 hypothetical protein FRACYDRAFT_233533 [Fragilariopsis cylindrus CCMP1102]